MKPLEIDSWGAFKSYIDEQHPIRGRYLFRGQSDEVWGLESSFDRKFSRMLSNRQREVQESLLKNFRQECENYSEYERITTDEIRVLALAQHHGLPTRLLDWTESPYIAAYFAFHGAMLYDGDRDKRVAVWMLNKVDDYRFLWDGGLGVTLFTIPSWGNERLRRQNGWFTHARCSQRTLEEYVIACNAPAALLKITLPAAEAAQAISDLNLMGISARGLFADLTGATQNAFLRTIMDG